MNKEQSQWIFSSVSDEPSARADLVKGWFLALQELCENSLKKANRIAYQGLGGDGFPSTTIEKISTLNEEISVLHRQINYNLLLATAMLKRQRVLWTGPLEAEVVSYAEEIVAAIHIQAVEVASVAMFVNGLSEGAIASGYLVK